MAGVVKKPWCWLLAILASAFITACEAQTRLPKDLPSGSEITYISEGGFVPSFFAIVIKGHAMQVSDRSQATGNKQHVWTAKLSDDELKTLYRAFVDNQLDSIKPNKEIKVPDGKSRSIELKFSQERFYAITGDGIKAARSDTERFTNIEQVFGQLVRNHRK